MKLICPKCKGMKKFIVGIPVSRKCEEHGSVNMIHVNAEIEMPADPVEETEATVEVVGEEAVEEAEETDTTERPEELPVKAEEIPLESALAVLPDFGFPVLRNMARDLKVKSWWIMSKESLISEISDAMKAKHAASSV